MYKMLHPPPSFFTTSPNYHSLLRPRTSRIPFPTSQPMRTLTIQHHLIRHPTRRTNGRRTITRPLGLPKHGHSFPVYISCLRHILGQRGVISSSFGVCVGKEVIQSADCGRGGPVAWFGDLAGEGEGEEGQ